jgi:A/G-specific adenine glycosylase
VKFSGKLIGWYKKNKRDLPWRDTNDPYKIWLSEIILQQTRVDQGLEYYQQFISSFPDIASLAEADEEKILKLWQGLGYYSRARNLHATARFILENYQGQFPTLYEDILKLKGIGEYTAAAICSFAFNQPYPVVDGNVMRVISRLKGIEAAMNTSNGKKTIAREAEKLIDPNQPGVFNQAIMEFGALYCKPQKPDCKRCIFRSECVAYRMGKVDKLPVKQAAVQQKHRYFNYLVFISPGSKSVLLKKRSQEDIWKNLYDFPMIESDKKLTAAELTKKIKEKTGNNNLCHIHPVQKEYRHILTHRIIHARFIEIRCPRDSEFKSIFNQPGTSFIKATADTFNKFPIPRLIEKYVEENPIFT